MCLITIGVVCKHVSVSSITSELKDKLSEIKEKDGSLYLYSEICHKRPLKKDKTRP